MPPTPPEVIDLLSSSDDDNDEDLKRAIAMSLIEVGGAAEPLVDSQIHVSNPPEAGPTPTESKENSHGVAFGSVLLDRKAMEDERRARAAKRKREDGEPPEHGPADRRPPAPGSAASRKEVNIPSRGTGRAANSTSLLSTVQPVSTQRFLKGAVKRTWTCGYERHGDDIKIEEVFQKDKLELAILASYQWDDDWLLSKIDITRTRLICVAYARDKAHV
jgi:hypothetical protein